jgi:hypothetical protein
MFEGLPEVTHETEINVTYSYDLNGIMKCRVHDVISGLFLDTSLTPSSGAKEGGGSKIDPNDFLL